MKKILKRFAIVFSILLVLILATTVVIAAFFEKKIGNKILSETNKQLASELTVENFDLSLLTAFPNVSANLRGVVLKDNQDGVLLEAEQVSFRFGFFSLFGSTLKIKSVVVSNGALSVFIDQNGRGNYNIAKADSGETTSEPGDEDGIAISLADARLKNIELIYSDQQTGNEMVANVEDAVFSGEFSSKTFSLKSKASLITSFLENDGLRFLVGKKIDYDANIFVNLEEGVYKLEEVTLNVESNIFRLDGSVETWKEGPYFDLFLSSNESSLGAVIQLLPEEYLQRFGDFNSSGKFTVTATLNGLSNANQNPEIRMELEMKEGRITSPRLTSPLKDVSFTATFSNGKFRKNDSSTFKIENLKGYFNRELVELGLRIDNFDEPEIDFNLDGVMPMASVYGLFNNPKITKGAGEIEIQNLHIQGRYSDMIQPARIGQVASTGALEFDDAELTINGEEIILDRGRLLLDGNNLRIEELKLEGAGSELTFNGSAFNLLPVLFADSLNSQRAELEFQAGLTAEKIDIDRLMKLSAVMESEAEVGEEVFDSLKTVQIQKRERFTSLLKGTFNSAVKSFNYNLIEGQDFTGKLDLDNNELAILGNTRAMGGNFKLDGRFFFEEKPRLTARLIGGGINIKEFFRQAENFGQEVITNQNLQGTLNTKMAIYAYWDEEGNFLLDDLQVLSALGIENGELVNLKMLESFSTFVNIQDLRHIKFNNLQNFLEVRKQRLFIPVMFIQSNALNLTISGEHSFENDIRYNIKVNAGQVMANRLKSHDPTLQPVKARQKGFFNLYYTIAGNLDTYEVKANKRQIKSDFELSDIRRRDIQTALEKEFGIIELVREPEDWRDIPEFDVSGQKEEFLEWQKN